MEDDEELELETEDDDIWDFLEGSCAYCKGAGEVTCDMCEGTGCRRCEDGMKTCVWCNGTGEHSFERHDQYDY